MQIVYVVNSAVFSKQLCQHCSALKSSKQEDFTNSARIHPLHRNIPSSLSLAATVKPVCNTGWDNAHGQIRVTEAFTPSPCVTIRTLSPFASSAIACIQLQAFAHHDTHLEQLLDYSMSTMSIEHIHLELLSEQHFIAEVKVHGKYQEQRTNFTAFVTSSCLNLNCAAACIEDPATAAPERLC